MRRCSASLVLVGTLIVLTACGQRGTAEEAKLSPTPSFALETSPTEVSTTVAPSPTVGPVSSTASRTTPPASNPPASQACDANIERVSSLGSMGSSCDTARRVAAAYDAKIMAGGSFPEGQPITVDDGWSCRTTSTSGDGGEVFGLLCTKGTESITFEWGV